MNMETENQTTIRNKKTTAKTVVFCGEYRSRTDDLYAASVAL